MARRSQQNIFQSKWILIAVAFIVLFGVFYTAYSKQNYSNNQPSNSSSSETADWKTYTNSKFNFTMKYPQDWTINDQSYSSGGQEYIGFAIQGPLRSDIAEANSKNAYYIRVLTWDPTSKTLVANDAFGTTGEQFILQKEADDQEPKEVPVGEDFIKNSAEHITADQILPTFTFSASKFTD